MNGQCRRAFLITAILFAVVKPVEAQFTTAGEVFGRVTGVRATPVPDVAVKITSPGGEISAQRRTDANGMYRLANIPPGNYTLTFAGEPHQLSAALSVVVRAGSVQRIDYRFPSLQEHITVKADALLIESTRSDPSKYISGEAIENLPLQNRHFLDVLMIVPGVDRGVPSESSFFPRSPRNSIHVHGARANQNQFLFDGAPNNDRSDLNAQSSGPVFLAGPRSGSGAGPAGATFQVGTSLQPFNIDAIEQVQVSTSLFSSEYGNGSGGVINVVTRNGSDTPGGSLSVQHQSDDYVRESQQRFDRYQVSLTYGGPIRRGRTHVFASIERDDHSLGYDFSQPRQTVGPFLRDLDLTANKTERNRATAKISNEFSARHTASVTLNYSDETADVLHSWLRSRIEDLVPEDHQNESARLIVRDVAIGAGGRLLESLVSGTYVSRRYRSLVSDPTHVRLQRLPGGAIQYNIVGPYGGDSDNWLRTYSVSEKLSGQNQRGSWKIGLTLDRFGQTTHQHEWFNIAYFFGTTPAYGSLLDDAWLSPSVTESAAFVQYDWLLSSRSTLNLGLRSGRDDLVGQTTFEPRLGIAFDPSGQGRSVIRAGAGLYHDRTNLIGHTGADRPLMIEGPLDPVTLRLTPDAPPNEIVVDPNLRLPRTVKASAGYERQLPFAFVGGVHAHVSRSRDQFHAERFNRRTRALGNPRPEPRRGEIEYYTNAGESDVREFELELRRNFARGATVQASYNRQRARGNSSFDYAPLGGPLARITLTEEAPQRSSVSGPLDHEVEHAVKLSAVVPLPWRITLSAIGYWRSGLPFTVYESYFDGYPGAVFPEGYNSRRLDNYYNIDVRLAKDVRLGRHTFRAFVDLFNATDRRNVLQRNGEMRSNQRGPIGAPGTTDNPSFRRVTSRGGPRTAQIGVRWQY